jgi:hypothetical protein
LFGWISEWVADIEGAVEDEVVADGSIGVLLCAFATAAVELEV